MDTHTSLNSGLGLAVSGARGKWLVVDDDPLIRSVIASILEDHLNASVIECDSGDLAWEVWRQFPGIEGVITDRDMPGMDGLELAARIRAEDPAIPVILVTACPEGLDPEWLGKRGIDRMLTKPFSCGELASAVHASQEVTNLLAAA